MNYIDGWLIQDKRGFPRGQLLSHDQGHAAMLPCLGNVKETLVLVPGSRAGSFILSQDANDRCLSHRLGNAPEGRLSQGLWKDQHGMAQQSSGEVGCRAVVKSTFVESKTSPSPKRLESESSPSPSPKRFESESSPSPKRFESKSKWDGQNRERKKSSSKPHI